MRIFKKQLDVKRVKDRIMEIAHKTQCGHAASAMSCANLLCDLYNRKQKMKHEVIIILSKGHGALAQYVCLNELGILPDKILDTYYKDGGLSGHATLDPKHGIHASTGSLGHGLAIGLGYAIAKPKAEVWVILSDGELDEGSTLEALRLTWKLNVTNLLPIVDDNGWQGFQKAHRPSGMVDTSELLGLRPFRNYAVKGEGFGDMADTLSSHYTNVTDEVYRNWKKESPKIEKRRLDNLEKTKNGSKDIKESN